MSVDDRIRQYVRQHSCWRVRRSLVSALPVASCAGANLEVTASLRERPLWIQPYITFRTAIIFRQAIISCGFVPSAPQNSLAENCFLAVDLFLKRVFLAESSFIGCEQVRNRVLPS